MKLASGPLRHNHALILLRPISRFLADRAPPKSIYPILLGNSFASIGITSSTAWHVA